MPYIEEPLGIRDTADLVRHLPLGYDCLESSRRLDILVLPN